MGNSDYEKQRESQFNRAIGLAVIESIIAGIAILLILWVTDLSFWVTAIPIVAIVGWHTYRTAYKKIEK